MPAEVLFAVLGLAVPASLLLTYAALVRSGRWSMVTGFASLALVLVMIFISFRELFGSLVT